MDPVEPPRSALASKFDIRVACLTFAVVVEDFQKRRPDRESAAYPPLPQGCAQDFPERVKNSKIEVGVEVEDRRAPFFFEGGPNQDQFSLSQGKVGGSRGQLGKIF